VTARLLETHPSTPGWALFLYAVNTGPVVRVVGQVRPLSMVLRSDTHKSREGVDRSSDGVAAMASLEAARES
jgi:hypothetical protein